jgi:uracil-DNA glycosylase
MKKAILPKQWQEVLQSEIEKPYFSELMEFVDQAFQTKTIYPPKEQIFNAFKECTLDNVKVVILGQDPYHDEGQANGLCFSVNNGLKLPPSLVNIFKEIERNFGFVIPTNGDLSRWAEQGILLLNASLTVEAHQAGSHQGKGWETFSDAVIRYLAEEKDGIVFILWGAYAQKKAAFIDEQKHLILKSAHPSPLSVYRGFIGNQHFILTNNYLKLHDKKEINW